MKQWAHDIFFGVAVGDALGVPVEFLSREEIGEDPVTDMRGFGTHRQPPGTWSDDTSLTLCLAEQLCEGYDLRKIGNSFVAWREEGLWTAHGSVFDIGGTTADAIQRLKNAEIPPQLAGGIDERENGNGSLMRILPAALYVRGLDLENRLQIIRELSSLTHGHFRSWFSCFLYVELALGLMEDLKLESSLMRMRQQAEWFIQKHSPASSEIALFDNILKPGVELFPAAEIRGSGYVIHSLEASIWCLQTTRSYREAVLKAVNLGEDTDTTAAITGGLAGLLYGYLSIPNEWIQQLARKNDLDILATNLNHLFSPS